MALPLFALCASTPWHRRFLGSKPIETKSTLEGQDRNRRVELQRE